MLSSMFSIKNLLIAWIWFFLVGLSTENLVQIMVIRSLPTTIYNLLHIVSCYSAQSSNNANLAYGVMTADPSKSLPWSIVLSPGPIKLRTLMAVQMRARGHWDSCSPIIARAEQRQSLFDWRSRPALHLSDVKRAASP